jgi:hypothetical protein
VIIIAWLEGLNAPDLGLFVNGLDFAAVQDMSEEFRQEVRFQGAFGTDGPVLRSVRHADEDQVTFTAILLKRGVARGLNDEDTLKTMRDFEVVTRRGTHRSVYRTCNWTRIAVNSGLDQVTITCDISIPGYTRD